MKTSHNIVHKGLVKSVENGIAYITFVQEGGCSACSARSACTMTEASTHILRLPSGGKEIRQGEEVTVSISSSNGYQAVVLGYLLPLALMLFVLILTVSLHVPEHIAGLSALGVLVPYFLILRFFRGSIKNNVSFQVHKQ